MINYMCLNKKNKLFTRANCSPSSYCTALGNLLFLIKSILFPMITSSKLEGPVIAF